jgi:hypothetical protein
MESIMRSNRDFDQFLQSLPTLFSNVQLSEKNCSDIINKLESASASMMGDREADVKLLLAHAYYHRAKIYIEANDITRGLSDTYKYFDVCPNGDVHEAEMRQNAELCQRLHDSGIRMFNNAPPQNVSKPVALRPDATSPRGKK